MPNRPTDVFLAIRQALTKMGVRGCRLLRRTCVAGNRLNTGCSAGLLTIDLGEAFSFGEGLVGLRNHDHMIQIALWIPDREPTRLSVDLLSRRQLANQPLAVIDLGDPNVFDKLAAVLAANGVSVPKPTI